MLLRPDPDCSSLSSDAPESTRCQTGPVNGSHLCRALTSLRLGQLGELCRIDAGATTRERLSDLGFVRGTPVEIVRTAPLGDPLEIHVRGTRLCLRKAEARSIWVHPAAP
jgi:ferrous iron transport protein A